jgi:hypothetical protein
MIVVVQGDIGPTPSFPRKRESSGGEALRVALDPRLRGVDELLRVEH